MPNVSDFNFRADTGATRITSSMRANTADDLIAANMLARISMADVIKKYAQFADYIEGITPDILVYAMHEAFDLSQVYVPVETGALRDSGYLIITNRGKKPQVEIGYGRNNEPNYAALQHENMEFHHKAPTRAKYLQVALEESATHVQATIVALLKQAASSGLSASSLKAKQVVPTGVRVR